jgi:oligoribonuclease (3'-5' exoribonuclease)
MAVSSDNMVWVDLEVCSTTPLHSSTSRLPCAQMSGLDVDKDVILEISCLVTDKDLNVIAEVGNLF